MKLTAVATTLLTLGLGADMAAAACCDMKVCDGFNLKGNCKNGCYPYGKKALINRSGLKSAVASAKTDKDCYCALGLASGGSCEVFTSKPMNVPNFCLTGIKYAYCHLQ
ncbi:hypothetical protein LB504_010009 [Fusarium proliferatum]|nr:hypothetical protein LB504_010009 [Fusarium proliferatum]